MTYFSHRSNSRIDLVLGNVAGMEYFADFGVMADEGCSIPNHVLQRLTLTISAGQQRMPKPKKPQKILKLEQSLDEVDRTALVQAVIQRYKAILRQAEEEGDIALYWKTWSMMAEEFLLEEYAILVGSEEVLTEPGFR